MGVNEQEMLGLALGWDRIHYRVVILILLPGGSWVESSEVRNGRFCQCLKSCAMLGLSLQHQDKDIRMPSPVKKKTFNPGIKDLTYVVFEEKMETGNGVFEWHKFPMPKQIPGFQFSLRICRTRTRRHFTVILCAKKPRGMSEEEMGSKLSGMKLRGSITLTQTSATGTRTMHGTIFKPNDYEEHNRAEVRAGFIKYDTYKYNPENSCPAFSGWIFGNDQENNSPVCVGPTPGVEGDREAAGDHSKLDRSMNSYEEAKRRRSRATESRAKQLKLSKEREEKKKARHSAKKDVEREMEKILGHPLFHSHPPEWVKTEARKRVASKGYSPTWLVTEWFGDNRPITLEDKKDFGERNGQSAAIQQTEKLQEEKIHSDLSKNLTTSEEDVVRDFNQDDCMTFEADRDFYTVGGVSNLKMEVSIHHF